MKYVLITHNANNLGDVAILEATLQHIHEIDKDAVIVLETNNVNKSKLQFPDIAVVDRLFPTKKISHTKRTFSLVFIIKNIPFLIETLKRAIIAINFSFFNKKKSSIPILNHIKSADIILSIAGDSISPQYAWYLRFFEIAIIHRLEKILVLYAQSIGPFKNKQIKYAKKYLSKASLILARDQKTYDLLHEYNVETKIEKTADTVISLETKKTPRAIEALVKYKVTEKSIGIVIRTNSYSGIPRKQYQNYLEGMLCIIQHMQNEGYTPLFISTIEEDTTAAISFCEQYSINAQILDLRQYLPSEAKVILSRFGLVISPRMHPIILSSSMVTPVIGLGKEFKMLNYLKIIGMEKLHIPMIPFNKKILVKIFDETMQNHEKISNSIRNNLSFGIEASNKNAQQIKKLLFNHR